MITSKDIIAAMKEQYPQLVKENIADNDIYEAAISEFPELTKELEPVTSYTPPEETITPIGGAELAKAKATAPLYSPRGEQIRENIAMVPGMASEVVEKAVPMAAPFFAGPQLLPQAVAAAGGGIISQSLKNLREGSGDVGDITKKAGAEAGISALVDVGLMGLRGTGGLVYKGLKKKAKPVIESTAAIKAIKELKHQLKRLDLYYRESTSKIADFIGKKTKIVPGDEIKGIDSISKELKLNKNKFAKMVSVPIKAMKKTLGKQYNDILEVYGPKTIDITDEVDTILDILAPGTRETLPKIKNKLRRLLDIFGDDVTKEASEITGEASKLIVKDTENIVFSEGHLLKQLLSEYAYKASVGTDVASKASLKQVRGVLKSLTGKLEDTAGDVYKRTNKLYSATLNTEKYVGKKLGQVGKAEGLKGIRENVYEAYNTVLKEGEVLGDEIFESTTGQIMALRSEILLLRKSGNKGLVKYADVLEQKIKNMSSLSFKRKHLTSIKEGIEKYQPINTELKDFKEAFRNKTKLQIEKEIFAQEQKIIDSGADWHILSLMMAGNAAAFFAPKALKVPISAITNMAALKKYSATAAALLLELSDDLLRALDKLPYKENVKQSIRVFIKRAVSGATEKGVNELLNIQDSEQGEIE